MQHPFGLALVGLLLALVACFIGLMTAGAGHGWVAPLFYSFGLFLIYPIVLIRALKPRRDWLMLDAAIVVFAVVVDILLVLDLIARADGPRWRERELFLPGIDKSIYPFFAIWLAIWFGWQVVAVRTLILDFKQGAERRKD
jgi:hypothetical protein